MQVEMHKTWQGYEVRWMDEDTGHWLYVRSVRNGKVKAFWDYTHAGHFSEKTAQKHVNNIKNSVYGIYQKGQNNGH